MGKKRICIVMAFVISLMLMMNTEVFAYQEDNDWYDLKDSTISISLPEGSEIEEYSEDDTEADGHVFSATIPVEQNGPLDLEVYYSATDYDEEYIYFYADKEAARDYYETIGEDAIIDCIGASMEQDYNLSIEPSGFFEGEDVSFVRAIVKIKEADTPAYNAVVYVTGNTISTDDTVVNKMFFFSEQGGTYEDTDAHRKVEESCLSDFFDTYDEEFAGGGYDWSEDEYSTGSDMGEIVEALGWMIPLILVLCAFFAVLKKKRVNAKAPHVHKATARTTDSKIDLGEWKPAKNLKNMDIFRREEKHTFAGSKRAEESDRLCGEFIPETDSEQRYYQSLLTLRKSGLLTKQEMNEMLEKHAEVKARQQR